MSSTDPPPLHEPPSPPRAPDIRLPAAWLGAASGLVAGLLAALVLPVWYLLFVALWTASEEGWATVLPWFGGGALVCGAAVVIVWWTLRSLMRRLPRVSARVVVALTFSAGLLAYVLVTVLLPNDLGWQLVAQPFAGCLAGAGSAFVVNRRGRLLGWVWVLAIPAVAVTVAVAVMAGSLSVVGPRIGEMNSHIEITGQIEDIGGEVATVDGWKATGAYAEPEEGWLDIGYESPGGDRVTLRHVGQEQWGDRGTAQGHFLCGGDYTCSESGPLLRIDTGDLHTLTLTLDNGAGVSLDTGGDDYSRAEEELVDELAQRIRQATPREREHLVETLASQDD